MLKVYLLELYIYYFEKVVASKETEKINKIWKNIKNNESLLNLAITLDDNYNIKSKIIAFKILKDREMYETNIYQDLINKIYSNSKLCRTKLSDRIIDKTFLMLTLENKNLILSKKQKEFLIYEAENSPCTEKFYKENIKDERTIHGNILFDIRYEILKNKNFTLQEKKKLFMFFYLDDEIKLVILEELEWEIFKELDSYNINVNYSTALDIENHVIIKLMELNDVNLLSKINLCIDIRKKISENVLKMCINNE